MGAPQPSPRAQVLLRAMGALIAGLLVACAFPITPTVSAADGPVAAWFGLVPLLLVAMRSRPAQSFRWGWLAGMIMNLISFWWLLRLGSTFGLWPLMVLAWIGLAAYCALYWGLFALLVSDLWRRSERWLPGAGERGRGLLMVLLVPLFWVGLEYLRGVLFTGFPWNFLGVSQYGNLVVMRVATLGGVYAISALLMTMNMALAATANRVIGLVHGMADKRRFNAELALGLLICAICWSWGFRDLRNIRRQSPVVEPRITVVQPNLSQMGTAESSDDVDHYEIVFRLLASASRSTRPDLLVLPETALPTVLRFDPVGWQTVTNIIGAAPLLTGCLDADSVDDADALRLYNAALLISQGQIEGTYRKQHLVPFGEYFPLINLLPFPVPDPLGFSCLAGDQPGVMSLPVARPASTQSVDFATLICFEDAFAPLAASAVDAGAHLLLVLTNDGWFDRSGAARQHMAHSVLRAVEQAVPVLRAANSGVSCLVLPDGRVTRIFADEKTGSYENAGFRSYAVPVPARAGQTPYARHGDLLLAWPATLLTVGFLLVAAWDYRKNRRRLRDAVQ